MHIPDGYLSPSTCGVLYGLALPFWYRAIQQAKKALSARVIPLLSVFSAFSFVVMMFNLPLPGGTTGHAVGVGIATIVLGPWGSIISISVALLIQAFFFGDGGITALGANCFNMAIAGSLVTYAVYRLISGRSPLESKRRVVAAAIGGYVAINFSALLAAIEFGIQPMLFKDSSGAPLYAPYPLSVSIPAMMIGHLTIAGLAELVLSAGVVAYLQNSSPALLEATAPNAEHIYEIDGGRNTARVAKRLWVGIALLLVLTPLGLLAAGSAWGEWSPSDFADPATRTAITEASGKHNLPEAPPKGLDRLSRVWTAPISHYAPAFMKSAAFGYVMSAMIGSGLIVIACVSLIVVAGLRSRRDATANVSTDSDGPTKAQNAQRRTTRHGPPFLERTANSLLEAVEYSLYAEDMAANKALLQVIDPRVKLIGILLLIISVAMSRNIFTILIVLALTVAASILSRIPLVTLASRVWLTTLYFTGLIVLPAIFTTPGQVLCRVPFVNLPIIYQGVTSAVLILTRVETAATLALVLVLSTPWAHLLKALRVLGMPALLVTVLGMTYRYIFLMLRTAHDMFESRRSRMVGALDGPQRRRLAASSAGVLLTRTAQLAGDVYSAMVSRGFQGDAFTMHEFRITAADCAAALFFALFAVFAFALGRLG